MRIQFTRLLIIPVTTLLSGLAVAALSPNAGPAPSLSDTGMTGLYTPGTAPADDPASLAVTGAGKPVAQQPLLLAKKEKVDVCHFLPNGKYITQNIPYDTYVKLNAEHPHEWLLGKCEDVVSPHTFHRPAGETVTTS